MEWQVQYKQAYTRHGIYCEAALAPQAESLKGMLREGSCGSSFLILTQGYGY